MKFRFPRIWRWLGPTLAISSKFSSAGEEEVVQMTLPKSLRYRGGSLEWSQSGTILNL